MLELNKIYCGDCLDLMKEIPDKSIDLIISDPPYNINKAEWDTIENYPEWILKNAKEYQRVLKDNGSFYLFHNDFLTLVYLLQKIRNETEFNFKQFITWNKIDGKNDTGFIKNRLSIDSMRNYYSGFTEYILYFTFQDETGLETITEQYLKPNNKFAQYLTDEFKRAGVTNRELAMLFPSKTGGLTGCVSNWVNGDNIITKEQYEKIRNYLNNKETPQEYSFLRKEYEELRKEYEELRKEYEELRKEYEELRYVFNTSFVKGNKIWENSNVWHFPIEHGIPHPTPKPIQLLKNIILHSSTKNGIVLDPCCGSGSTCIAAIKTGRQFIGIEKEQQYVDLSHKRIAGENNTKLQQWF